MLSINVSEKRIDSLLEGTSRSFFLSLKVLPKKIRRQISLTYLLARLADTIADSKVGENGALMKFLEEYNPKTINALIRKLLQCFSRRNYVGYTATPFANILVHENKSHKDYGEDIFPKSFIYDISPASNHQGLETIFKGENDDEGIKSDNLSNFLVPINDFCVEPSNLFCKEGWFPPKHKSDHVPKYNDSTHPVDNNLDEKTLNFYLKLNELAKKKYGKELDVAPSLIHAIMSFILACAVRNIRSIQQFYSIRNVVSSQDLILHSVTNFKDWVIIVIPPSPV